MMIPVNQIILFVVMSILKFLINLTNISSVSEIIQIIDTSKNSFTCDYYDISMNFIKLIGS